MARIMVGSVCAGVWGVIASGATAWGQPPAMEPFAQEIPSAGYKMEMVPVPGDAGKGIAPFWMSKTEVTWEAFDTFIYRLDEEDGKLPGLSDAVTRPSKPYLPPDRGFGHEGYAAICVGPKNAAAFCVWLSERSGRRYRLATEAEWEHAALAGATTAYPWGEGAEAMGEHAWFSENAKETPHPVGTRKANAWGLHDMLGNVREWVVGADGVAVTKGGSFEDGAEALRVSARVPLKKEWNASDPQVPKSQWWLSDGKTVGFRVVCEARPERNDGAGQAKPTPVVEPAKKE